MKIFLIFCIIIVAVSSQQCKDSKDCGRPGQRACLNGFCVTLPMRFQRRFGPPSCFANCPIGFKCVNGRCQIDPRFPS